MKYSWSSWPHQLRAHIIEPFVDLTPLEQQVGIRDTRNFHYAAPFNTRAITDDWPLNGLSCQVMNLIDNSFCSAHRRVIELFSLFCAALRQNAAFSADREAAFMTLSHFSEIKNKLK